MSESIAERVFTDFYPKYKAEKYDIKTVLYNFLPAFVEEVADEWGEECEIDPVKSYDPIDKSKPFFEVDTYNGKRIVVTEDGRIWSVKARTYETGGTTWNGDDEYYKEIATQYTEPELIDTLENIKELPEKTELTIELMEQIASELVSTICQ